MLIIPIQSTYGLTVFTFLNKKYAKCGAELRSDKLQVTAQRR